VDATAGIVAAVLAAVEESATHLAAATLREAMPGRHQCRSRGVHDSCLLREQLPPCTVYAVPYRAQRATVTVPGAGISVAVGAAALVVHGGRKGKLAPRQLRRRCTHGVRNVYRVVFTRVHFKVYTFKARNPNS